MDPPCRSTSNNAAAARRVTKDERAGPTMSLNDEPPQPMDWSRCRPRDKGSTSNNHSRWTGAAARRVTKDGRDRPVMSINVEQPQSMDWSRCTPRDQGWPGWTRPVAPRRTTTVDGLEPLPTARQRMGGIDPSCRSTSNTRSRWTGAAARRVTKDDGMDPPCRSKSNNHSRWTAAAARRVTKDGWDRPAMSMNVEQPQSMD